MWKDSIAYSEVEADSRRHLCITTEILLDHVWANLEKQCASSTVNLFKWET